MGEGGQTRVVEVAVGVMASSTIMYVEDNQPNNQITMTFYSDNQKVKKFYTNNYKDKCFIQVTTFVFHSCK